jgi:hypothetical protein
MSKIHFVEGDTDSVYWAVNGSEDKPTNKGLSMLSKIILSIMRIFKSLLLQIFIPLITAILLLILKWRRWHSIKNFLDLQMKSNVKI